jgi:hypothetical protein
MHYYYAMNIVYRVCDVVNSLHRGLDGSENPRPNGMSKTEVIKTCARSLKDSLQNIDHKIYLIGDRVSKELWEFLVNELNPFFQENSSEKLGGLGSLSKCVEIISSFSDNEFVYMLEDDYLHDPTSFHRVLDFINFAKQIDTPWFIHPSDYPDQYRRPQRSYIFQTNTGYWREVSSTTFTMMFFAKTFKKFYKTFQESLVGVGDDGIFSRIFKNEAMCFSPLPGIATHLHAGTYSNYVNWGEIINKYND